MKTNEFEPNNKYRLPEWTTGRFIKTGSTKNHLIRNQDGYISSFTLEEIISEEWEIYKMISELEKY